ncbi:uncharacterized protein LOC127002888 [Eriocheir sinensis]|uniref:uncharacterized protein LOC127002888 n=1 Tax=Eriocheir sinensis TaxID=95602 RepID=UPI0021C947E2|nr:uncharacterized protein LOC127002888 [Eriocheir sinensis]
MSRKGPKKSDQDQRTHWCHSDVLNLVTKVGESWPDFCSGIRKKKFIWKDIADALGEDGFVVNGQECDRKWRNLKIRYLAVLEKRLNGEKTAHRIDYFEGIHSFLKDDPGVLTYLEERNLRQNIKSLNEEDEDADEPLDTADDGVSEWSDKSVQQLLDLLMEFKDWFTDKDNNWDDATIWETISEQMKLEGHQPSPDQCRHKWQFLTQEYQENKAEAEASGSVPLWQYYTRVRHVLSQVGMPPTTKFAAITKSNSGSTKSTRRGTKRSASAAKSTTMLKICKKEAPDMDIVSEELNESISDPADLDLTDNPEPSSRTTTGGTQRDAFQPAELHEVCQRLEKIEENMAVSRRLDSLEAQLDFAAEQRRAQQQTNSLLNQVLIELSGLRRTLSTQNTQKMGSQDPTDLASGITIVVPHSQQL